RMDPRVKTPALGLTQQFTLSKQLYDGLLEVRRAQDAARELREQIRTRRGSGGDERALVELDQKIAAIEGQVAAGVGGGRGAAPEGPETLNSIAAGLNQLMGLLQGADVTPTTQLAAAVPTRLRTLREVMGRWNAVKQDAAKLSLTAPSRP